MTLHPIRGDHRAAPAVRSITVASTPAWLRVCVLVGAMAMPVLHCAASAVPRTDRAGGQKPPAAGQATVDDRGFDVLHYDLTLEVADSTLTGKVVLRAIALETGLQELVLDLYDEFDVADVSCPTQGVAAVAHSSDRLTISLALPPAPGDTIALEVLYAGRPRVVSDNPQPFTFATHRHEGRVAPVIYSLSFPDRSGAWWPCKDAVSDRATATVAVTVADTLVAASNGVLQDVAALEGGRRCFRWSHAHPIAPYLISVAISDYVTISDSLLLDVDGITATVPLQYYVYPEDEAAARVDLACIKDAMTFYSTLFGPYPFHDEKYGIAEIAWNGCMEHQTCTSTGSYYLTGTGRYEWMHVHELAHQWWGDYVGLADWRDVWLNEGFATYAEALWFEHQDGAEAYHEYMQDMDAFAPPEGPDFPGPIYNPDELFGVTPYNKGAWVLHMLRHVIGDEAFFQSLRAYLSRFGGHEGVTTDDFRLICEEQSGQDLGAFFEQWIYQVGRPAYASQWYYEPDGTGYKVSLHVSQTQADYDAYRMPIDVCINTVAGPQRFVVQNGDREEVYSFELADLPTELLIDPDGWILKATPAPQPTAALFRAARPNPTRRETILSFFTPALELVALDVYDVAGRRVCGLFDGLSGGERQIPWPGRDAQGRPVPSGVYFARLRTPRSAEAVRIVLMR